MANEYTNDINIKNTISLRDILAELPSYVKVVFRGIENKASSRTRLGYAIDIKTFYNFLCSECPQFRGRKPIDIIFLHASPLLMILCNGCLLPDSVLPFQRHHCCYVVKLSRKSKIFAGGDALMGNTRTHPEHDG